MNDLVEKSTGSYLVEGGGFFWAVGVPLSYVNIYLVSAENPWYSNLSCYLLVSIFLTLLWKILSKYFNPQTNLAILKWVFKYMYII